MFFSKRSNLYSEEQEYLESESKLNQCQLDIEKVVPVCPTVEVKNTNGIVFAIIGLLFYIGSIAQIGIYKKQEKDKKKTKKK